MRNSFTTPLIVTPLDDGRRWELVRAFRYITVPNDYILIPKGFVTDFASIPSLFWSILPRWGKYGKAAVLHDYMYVTKVGYTRKETDDIFRQAMLKLGTKPWKATVMYWAVRLFGKFAWEAY